MCVGAVTVSAQAQPYGLEQLEQQFLSRNYMLIAAKFDIGRAEAEVVQEKLWPNPVLSVDEFNLWSNATSETMPPLLGSYGRTQQVSIELEQLIETAGKRKKRVAVKQLEHRMAVHEFEELVRELKKELRQTYYHVVSQKQSLLQLRAMVDLFEQLSRQYARQSQQQNVSLADYRRVQAELISLRKEQLELEDDIASSVHVLRVLTQLDDITVDQLQDGNTFESRLARLPADVVSLALSQNIGLKRQLTAVEQAEAELRLEKANRKPDVTLQVGYDRGGNIMQDFVGLGVSMDLPLFNRNKGNIQAAKQSVELQRAQQASLQWELESAVRKRRDQLLRYERMLQDWSADAIHEQQAMVDRYRKHLQGQQITLMEFIDFVQAAREAHGAFLDVWENYNTTLEELQYLVGSDF